jgi:hypothetical protein
LAAITVCSLGLQAQEPETNFSLDWKTRLGYAPSAKDNLRQSSLGFGLNLGYKVGPGKVGFELGYFYKTGDNYLTMPDDSLNARGQAMNPLRSIEDKRNELSGITVRLSYQQDINPTWSWQAGLQLGSQFKHQYIGDSQSVAYTAGWDRQWNAGDAAREAAANALVSPNSWHDTYNGTPTDKSLNPSPFVGVSWNIDKESSLEFNLLLLNYKAIEYHHYNGTATNYHGGVHYENGSPTQWVGPIADDYSARSSYPYDKLDTKNSVVPHIEITYTFHF